jgi:predicted GNAT superfamily acetyltransferase
MKFSKSQILLLLNMQDVENVPPSDRAYYAETGRYKPFTRGTINSLVKKGYIVVERTTCDDTVHYCKRGINFSTLPKFTFADYSKAK